MTAPAKLSLGPLLYNWDADARRDFYFRIAGEAPVDIVYLGEVVCSKRAPFWEPHLAEIAERLVRAGKEVVYSTLALLMNGRETEALGALASEPGITVEANDVAALRLLAGRPHVIGPFINVYNEGTLNWLAERGATRVVLPAELPGSAVETLARTGRSVAFELQAFGRLPLALSARCYHARAHGLHKDGCQFVCGFDKDGLAVETLDGQGFLAVNGTQTMSHTVRSLLKVVPAFRDSGIEIFRLWPQSLDMIPVIELFRAVLDGREEPERAEASLSERVSFAPLSRALHEGMGIA